MGVYVCPVCSGKGIVDGAFYTDCMRGISTTKCKSCNGRGIVFDPVDCDPEPYRITDEEARRWIGYCTYGDYLRSKGENK